MLFFKIRLTPFQRQENIWSILTATNSFFFCISITGFKSNVLSISSPLQNRWITFPSDKQVFGALPHFSRVKIDCALAQKAKSMQCKMAFCWCLKHMLVESLTGPFHAQRFEGSTSVFSHATSNQLTTLSARYLDDDLKNFLLGPTRMFSLNLDRFERSKEECSSSQPSFQSLYWLWRLRLLRLLSWTNS